MDEVASKMCEIKQELELLRNEIRLVLAYTESLWSTESDHGNRHFPNTIYGFLMAAMAKVDFLSKHWIRRKEERQTGRMIDFMHSFLGYDKGASEIAVHFFRHNLMHASDLAEMHDDKGRSYRWLLVHGDGSDFPRECHMLFKGDKLDFGLGHFVDDLISAVPKLEDAMRADPEILRTWDGIERKIRSFRKLP